MGDLGFRRPIGIIGSAESGLELGTGVRLDILV